VVASPGPGCGGRDGPAAHRRADHQSPSCARKPGPSAGRADGIERKLAEVSALLSRTPARIDGLTAAQDRQDDKVGGQARREGAFGRRHVLQAGDAGGHGEVVGRARRGGGRRLVRPGVTEVDDQIQVAY
jgi:hypothetical protein